MQRQRCVSSTELERLSRPPSPRAPPPACSPGAGGAARLPPRHHSRHLCAAAAAQPEAGGHFQVPPDQPGELGRPQGAQRGVGRRHARMHPTLALCWPIHDPAAVHAGMACQHARCAPGVPCTQVVNEPAGGSAAAASADAALAAAGLLPPLGAAAGMAGQDMQLLVGEV